MSIQESILMTGETIERFYEGKYKWIAELSDGDYVYGEYNLEYKDCPNHRVRDSIKGVYQDCESCQKIHDAIRVFGEEAINNKCDMKRAGNVVWNDLEGWLWLTKGTFTYE